MQLPIPIGEKNHLPRQSHPLLFIYLMYIVDVVGRGWFSHFMCPEDDVQSILYIYINKTCRM